MQRKVIGSVIAVVLLGALAVGQAQQAQESYLDVFTVQVKPEKRADFDAVSRKIAVANRENKGDTWLAMETTYGPGNRVTFISTRNTWACKSCKRYGPTSAPGDCRWSSSRRRAKKKI